MGTIYARDEGTHSDVVPYIPSHPLLPGKGGTKDAWSRKDFFRISVKLSLDRKLMWN